LQETTTHTIGQKVLDMSATQDESATLHTRGLFFSFIFFNRAAMGRARLMVYTSFIFFIYFFHRAAMGRARFMVYAWFTFYLFFF